MLPNACLLLVTPVTFTRYLEERLTSVFCLASMRMIREFHKRLADRKMGILLSARGHRCVPGKADARRRMRLNLPEERLPR